MVFWMFTRICGFVRYGRVILSTRARGEAGTRGLGAYFASHLWLAIPRVECAHVGQKSDKGKHDMN